MTSKLTLAMFRRPEAAQPKSDQTRTKNKPRPSTLRRVFHWAQLVLTIAVVAFWFLELRPVSLGGNASYAIVSGTSMNPVYHTGDVVIVHKHSSYKVREIVAYKVPKPSPQAGLEVIHRLVGGNGTKGWTVQGDNRTAPDQWHPKDSDIVGSAWVHIPNAGVVVRYAHSPLGIAAVLALIAVGVVFKKAPSDKKDEQEPEAPAPAVAAAPPPEPLPAPVTTETYPSRELPAPPVPVLPPAPPPEPEPAPVHVPVAAFVPAPDTAELARLSAIVQALQVERASLQSQLEVSRRELELARTQLASVVPAGGLDLTRQRELERSLTEALLSAAQAGAELRLQAHREAEAIIAEAHERAARVEHDAAGERRRAVTDLESLRSTLQAALASLDDASTPEPDRELPGSAELHRSVVDLFETERQRARGDGSASA
jgi:signal peptidase I